MFVALLAALALAVPDSGATLVPVSLPARENAPNIRGAGAQPGAATPAPRRRFFGLGVRFQDRGGAQGIALFQVVADSPADHAGFTVGLVVAEIDGQSTLGRAGEDCTRMVLDAGGTVSLKYYDPVTFKLRTKVLEKAWFLVPN